MPKKFNENLMKAMRRADVTLLVIDASEESCRAMYTAILKDCERHLVMLRGEIDLHKEQKKWDK